MPDVLDDSAEAQKLREILHQRIDKLPACSLSAADRLLLQIEVEQARAELDLAFDSDYTSQKLSPEKVAKAVSLHRANHPYRG